MRFLAAILAIVLFSSITAPPISSTTGHGCAPSTPPPVSGSLVSPPATAGLILINEVLLVPHSTWNCSESGVYFVTTDTWLELYNPQNQPFDLYAVHASIDSGPNTNAYYLPFGAAIAAHGYLVVFPRISSSFLSTETSTLRFILAGATIDQVTVPQLGPDQSYARIPDGASSWEISSLPTIDASNTSLSPTPTPIPTSRSTSSSSSSQHGSHGSSNSSSTTTSGNKGRSLINGTQPKWKVLQLPTTPASTPPVDATPTTVVTSSLLSGAVLDLPRRIALTLLAIALALALFWCWRLFAPR